MIKTTLKIEGMMCGMCESHINEAVRNAFSVKKVTSSHLNKKSVIISENEINESDIKKVIEKTGYTLLNIYTEHFEKKRGLFGFLKK